MALLVALAATSTTFPAFAVESRERQDYGGPRRETSPGEVALWVPRVALFPLWLTSELLVRRPVGALVVVAEREQWPEELVSLFTFGDRRQITVFPSALFDFGLLPSVGFNATWKYFLAEPNVLKLHFGTWGPDWIAARAVDRYALGHGRFVSLDTSFVRRQDRPFFGMGPRSGANGRLRYQSATAEAGIHYEQHFGRASVFSIAGGVRSLTFGDGSCCGEPSLASAVQSGAIPAPPGFGRGYAATFQRVSLALDSRRPRPNAGSGVRVEVHGEGDFVPDGQDAAGRRAWVKYGGSVGAALDLTDKQRVVSLTLTGELADPLQGTIPFTDQVSLGGDRLMRGFLGNRLIDRSALVATLQYTWPIWVYLDGVIEADLGNVFGAQLAGFDPGLLRLTSGIGMRSNGARDSGFEILVAGGTDPLDTGFHVTSFRFVIGSHHGF